MGREWKKNADTSEGYGMLPRIQGVITMLQNGWYMVQFTQTATYLNPTDPSPVTTKNIGRYYTTLGTTVDFSFGHFWRTESFKSAPKHILPSEAR